MLVGLGLFILAPLAMLVLWAFADYWFFPNAFPSIWTFSWWKTVFSGGDLSTAVMWSFIFAPTVVIISAVVCLPAAYVFARREFPGKRLMLMTLFATNAFPKMGLYIAMASVLYSLNLMGTFLGVVIVQLLNTLVIMTWIPAAAFASVPPSLEEAARDAGAGAWRTFFRVTFPLASPGILVAVILAFLASFDEAQGTFLSRALRRGPGDDSARHATGVCARRGSAIGTGAIEGTGAVEEVGVGFGRMLLYQSDRLAGTVEGAHLGNFPGRRGEPGPAGGFPR